MEDDFVGRELSRVQMKISKANDAFSLQQELRSSLTEKYKELLDRVGKKKGAIVRSIFEERDALTIPSRSGANRMLLVVANARGEDVFSTFGSLVFLNSMTNVSMPLTVVPRVSHPIWSGESPDNFEKLLAFCSREGVDTLVAVRDGLPYFDGFYVSIPEEMKKENLAKEVVDHVEKQGHIVGRYSMQEDHPRHSIITEGNLLMARLVRMGIEVYGFTCGEDLNATKDGLNQLYVLHSRTTD